MSLLTAIVKSSLRYTNRRIAEHSTQKAKDIAFAKTGIKIKGAKAQKKYANGATLYKSEYTKLKKNIDQRYNAFENFINDL